MEHTAADRACPIAHSDTPSEPSYLGNSPNCNDSPAAAQMQMCLLTAM